MTAPLPASSPDAGSPSSRSTEMAVQALQLDFHSQIRDRDYRLFVSVPGKPAPPQGYPVLYLIDGNLHFGIAVDTLRIQACWPDVRDAVVVGIGYPTDRVADALQLRMDDLTTPMQAGMQQQAWFNAMPAPPTGYGQMDAYLRMLEEEVKPRVAAVAPLDLQDQTLMGHSLGGLTTLHALLRGLGRYRHYVAIAPSIWWNDRELLSFEAAFAARVQAGAVQARVLVSVGELESSLRYPKEIENRIKREDAEAMSVYCRMVSNAVELGARLAALPGPGLAVQTVVHLGDDHNMVPPAGIARGIRFALRNG